MSTNPITTSPVSVVIPTYNGRHLLEKHLPHVLAAMRNDDELIIVDDDSSDDTIQWLGSTFNLKKTQVEPEINELPENYHPDVNEMVLDMWFGKFVENSKRIRIVVFVNPENLRFAASANIGFALASNQVVFLLNNDVSPSASVIEKLLPHFDDEEVFGVGCLEYAKSIEGEKSGKNKLWFERGLFRHSKADDFTSGETAWVSGGSGMFDREKWLDLKGFDKRFYPAYWEDVDICFRARKWGWKSLFEAGAIVFHEHETTNKEAFGQEKINHVSWKNAQAFTWKNGNLLQKLQYLVWKPYWLINKLKNA